MPHQCTQCGHTFPDGSKEMLSGCPDCGGNKFQFQPAADARESEGSKPSSEPPSTPDPTPPAASAPSDESTTDADGNSRRTTEESTVVESESADDSDMAALRRELNDQFESIKILEPGQYELNLMELYNREEYIIALQEDGQYAIEVPETWLND